MEEAVTVPHGGRHPDNLPRVVSAASEGSAAAAPAVPGHDGHPGGAGPAPPGQGGAGGIRPGVSGVSAARPRPLSPAPEAPPLVDGRERPGRPRTRSSRSDTQPREILARREVTSVARQDPRPEGRSREKPPVSPQHSAPEKSQPASHLPSPVSRQTLPRDASRSAESGTRLAPQDVAAAERRVDHDVSRREVLVDTARPVSDTSDGDVQTSRNVAARRVPSSRQVAERRVPSSRDVTTRSGYEAVTVEGQVLAPRPLATAPPLPAGRRRAEQASECGRRPGVVSEPGKGVPGGEVASVAGSDVAVPVETPGPGQPRRGSPAPPEHAAAQQSQPAPRSPTPLPQSADSAGRSRSAHPGAAAAPQSVAGAAIEPQNTADGRDVGDAVAPLLRTRTSEWDGEFETSRPVSADLRFPEEQRFAAPGRPRGAVAVAPPSPERFVFQRPRAERTQECRGRADVFSDVCAEEQMNITSYQEAISKADAMADNRLLVVLRCEEAIRALRADDEGLHMPGRFILPAPSSAGDVPQFTGTADGPGAEPKRSLLLRRCPEYSVSFFPRSAGGRRLPPLPRPESPPSPESTGRSPSRPDSPPRRMRLRSASDGAVCERAERQKPSTDGGILSTDSLQTQIKKKVKKKLRKHQQSSEENVNPPTCPSCATLSQRKFDSKEIQVPPDEFAPVMVSRGVQAADGLPPTRSCGTQTDFLPEAPPVTEVDKLERRDEGSQTESVGGVRDGGSEAGKGNGQIETEPDSRTAGDRERSRSPPLWWKLIRQNVDDAAKHRDGTSQSGGSEERRHSSSSRSGNNVEVKQSAAAETVDVKRNRSRSPPLWWKLVMPKRDGERGGGTSDVSDNSGSRTTTVKRIRSPSNPKREGMVESRGRVGSSPSGDRSPGTDKSKKRGLPATEGKLAATKDNKRNSPSGKREESSAKRKRDSSFDESRSITGSRTSPTRDKSGSRESRSSSPSSKLQSGEEGRGKSPPLWWKLMAPLRPSPSTRTLLANKRGRINSYLRVRVSRRGHSNWSAGRRGGGRVRISEIREIPPPLSDVAGSDRGLERDCDPGDRWEWYSNSELCEQQDHLEDIDSCDHLESSHLNLSDYQDQFSESESLQQEYERGRREDPLEGYSPDWEHLDEYGELYDEYEAGDHASLYGGCEVSDRNEVERRGGGGEVGLCESRFKDFDDCRRRKYRGRSYRGTNDARYAGRGSRDGAGRRPARGRFR